MSAALKVKNELVVNLNTRRDKKTAEAFVHRVYTKEEVFAGTSNHEAPDVFVDFADSYQASRQKGLGTIPEGLSMLILETGEQITFLTFL